MNKLSIASFTNLGYLLHERRFDGYDPQVEGKTVVVTGATSGIGREVAVTLSEMGARVIGVGRDPEKLDSLSSALSDPHLVLEADLSLMRDVRKVASEVQSEDVDILLNNVGVLLPDYHQTDEGLEKSFATNVAGHFLLTNELLPAMARGGSGRVIEMSSGGMYTAKIQPKRLDAKEKTYKGTFAYAQAKRAQVILTEMWDQKFGDRGVTFNSMHPGWVETAGVSYSLPTFDKLMKPLLRDVSQGADTMVWLAAAETGGRESGKFWFDRKSVPTHLSDKTVETEEDRVDLWAKMVQATGSDLEIS
jgi:dehydrogenase/reductase SDR family member 12